KVINLWNVILSAAKDPRTAGTTPPFTGFSAMNDSPKRDRIRSKIEIFTPAELRNLRALKTPYGIQKFIDAMPYHLAGTSWSPRRVLRERTAHCLEGAIFGAAALRVLGFPALVFDLEAEHDTDHVVAIFQVRGHWGAIAKS